MIEAVDLGNLYKVRTRHDNAMISPAWFLDRIEVKDNMQGDVYTFHCERWLGKNKADGKIDRVIYVKVSTRQYFHFLCIRCVKKSVLAIGFAFCVTTALVISLKDKKGKCFVAYT